MFKIKYEKKAEKFIKNLDLKIKVRIIDAIKKLEIDPFPRAKNHILETAGSSLLCELAVDKVRIYYTVEDRFIVIEEIEYAGIVKILEGQNSHKSGNKKNWSNQRRDIKRLSNWFKNLFRKR